MGDLALPATKRTNRTAAGHDQNALSKQERLGPSQPLPACSPFAFLTPLWISVLLASPPLPPSTLGAGESLLPHEPVASILIHAGPQFSTKPARSTTTSALAVAGIATSSVYRVAADSVMYVLRGVAEGAHP